MSKKFTKESKFTANESQNMALIGILTTQLLHQQYIEDFNPPRAIKPVEPDLLVRRIN